MLTYIVYICFLLLSFVRMQDKYWVRQISGRFWGIFIIMNYTIIEFIADKQKEQIEKEKQNRSLETNIAYISLTIVLIKSCTPLSHSCQSDFSTRCGCSRLGSKHVITSVDISHSHKATSQLLFAMHVQLGIQEEGKCLLFLQHTSFKRMQNV